MEARLVAQALQGTMTESPNQAERPMIGRLIKAGVLTPGKKKEPLHVLTKNATFAFDILFTNPEFQNAPAPHDFIASPKNGSSRRLSENGKNRHKNKPEKDDISSSCT